MPKLDDISPTGYMGQYKVQVLVEGEWVIMGLLTKSGILSLAKAFDDIQEEAGIE